MKSIRARFSLGLLALLSGVLILGNIAVFAQFQRSFRDELEKNQELLAQSNRRGLETFLSAVGQSNIAVVSDKLIGTTLSLADGDRLRMIAARSDVSNQFYHLTSTIMGADGYYYRSFLFLDDRIPLAAYFGEAGLDIERGTMSGVYRNTRVAREPWYHRAMEKNRAMHMFVSEDKKTLCLARKIQNTYYAGPNQYDGLGVMVTRVDIGKLEDLFSFSRMTENTRFYLIGEDNAVLFSSDETLIGEPFREDIMPSRAVRHESDLSSGMRLIFHTPYADIDAGIRPVVAAFAATSLIMLAVSAVLALVASTAFTRPIIRLSRVMTDLKDTRLFDPKAFARRRGDEIGRLYASFEALISRVNTLIRDVQTRTEEQKAAEMKMMQAQINPHFLYNAMDSINWIALTNGQDEIADMVGNLAALMRYSITEEDGDATLGQEIEHLNHYVALEQVRYRDRVTYSADVGDAFLSARLPRVTLQPLVENALRHGFRDALSCVAVTVTAARAGDVLHIDVSDDGAGCGAARLNAYLAGEESGLKVHGGLGVRNVNERLALRFPGKGGLCYLDRAGGGLTARVTVPLGESASSVQEQMR